jgi:GTP:adenosylcobinamide-phosphate guanylyltransferase
MADEKYPVIILAGGETPEKIIGEKEKLRAFLDIAGKPMVSWVLDAVKSCPSCGEMLVFGDTSRLTSELGLDQKVVSKDKGDLVSNFAEGMEAFKNYPLVLVVTADVPLITGKILEDLIAQALTMKADVYYPIIDVKYFDAKFPGGHRTTVKLREGTFTGGNIFILNPQAVLKNRKRIEAVVEFRKSPQKLVSLFGAGFMMKFALNQLDLKALENKATEILGAKMVGVRTPHPEIGFDVDKSSDLNLVRKIMGRA